MNPVIKLAMTFSALAMAWTQTAQAQTPPAPIEAFYCNMQEGKGMKDLAQVADRFSKWADSNNSGYSAWILTPQFGLGGQLPQVIWLGSAPNGADFGKGLDAWRKDGNDISDAFDSVIDCSAGHVLASSVEVLAPTGPIGDGVVMFTQCELEDGKTPMDAAKAQGAIAGELRKMGAKNASWMFVPALGGGDVDYDYMGVATFPNYAEFFTAYDMWMTGGMGAKARGMYKGVADCNEQTPTVWDVKMVRLPKS